MALEKLEPFVVFEGVGDGDSTFNLIPRSGFNLLWGICTIITGIMAILSWLVNRDHDDWSARITFRLIFSFYLFFYIYNKIGRAFMPDKASWKTIVV